MIDEPLVAAALADLDSLLDVVECWAGTMTTDEAESYPGDAADTAAVAPAELQLDEDTDGASTDFGSPADGLPAKSPSIKGPLDQGLRPAARASSRHRNEEDLTPTSAGAQSWRLRLRGPRPPAAGTHEPDPSRSGTPPTGADAPSGAVGNRFGAPDVRATSLRRTEKLESSEGAASRARRLTYDPGVVAETGLRDESRPNELMATPVAARRPQSPLLRWRPSHAPALPEAEKPGDEASSSGQQTRFPDARRPLVSSSELHADQLGELIADVLESALIESGIDQS